ncbi:dihydropyrimidinase [Stutzerimonas stutzeri]|jgi:dihydropyrimidinase|uniref:Dihydropyrimidinase n=3 Tax=Pseudomonadaceae TaxID=135621 RepID=A0ABX8IYP3_9GAMM|nr:MULTISPECIES: dihydropyrimidinase [Pseudomonadaceae]MAK87139.1 dihydropyrimidinase [Pseudomonas sp.]MBU1459361.1 dihydropyrimidinase [Gammaproteobacteria bacterium]MBU2339611.1 dihydropyrimidinase [Alphaproteobacteria bacterium]MBC8650484.1 dihydropyrimidinase [Pseudomonas sp. MT4]MBK3758739.1 dihydropyrimidinase [Stutzerimonas frequens]|tara:strand:+ start:20228 stop:21667 length:1440 start_codon:yes stop_codon:yes gene_type:complete
MNTFDTVIRNARVVTAADIFTSDIGIRDGRIAALGIDLPTGLKEIDAKGRHVTPGGIDSHVHLDQPTGDGSIMADDFLSGTVSAACGGTTTVIPFACQQKGKSLRAAVEDYHRRAGQKPVIDYAFHMIVTDPTPEILRDELPALIAEGYTSFKIYMTYDALKLSDREILDTLSVARSEGAMVMLHAENADCIAWLTERLLAAGHTAPRYHATSRPMLVEREATHRAIALAELVDVPILIVHVSGREAVEQIRWAQSNGLKVYAETCPQYLFLTADSMGCDDSFEGAKCICSPPPRDKANQQVIWDGLENGSFEVFSSDHAPFRYDGPDGKKAHGEQVSFDKVANGIPGIETRMALLWSEGVRTGRITPQSFVALTSTNAAKLYGLYPRKGSIAIGSDADLVIWDEDQTFHLDNNRLHHNVDYTPYEGMHLSAWPAMTLSRGDVVWDGEQPCGDAGRGQFLPCARPDPAKPRRRQTEIPL